MKVKYKKDKTIITLKDKEERGAVFNALRFCEIEYDYKKKIKGSIVSRLLNEWMKEARTKEKKMKSRKQMSDKQLQDILNELKTYKHQTEYMVELKQDILQEQNKRARELK